VVAVIALLISILLPALGRARESARATVCGTNLKQIFLGVRLYADENGGLGPAIGQPYGSLPNWGLVVQQMTNRVGTSPGELYDAESVLVCPTIQQHYREQMTRTYAMNATGHAGLPSDTTNYDDPNNRAHINLDALLDPAFYPLVLDAARATHVSDGPPPPRTASMLDFRQPAHVAERLGRFHSPQETFNAVHADGSVQRHQQVSERWQTPLP
jgi:hypothetical protein